MSTETKEKRWRVVVVGGHTRSIGKTQLVCDLIAAFPEARWIAGKITQYGHGVCAQNGQDCDCAPDEHICAIDWEKHPDSGTDSARFLAAGATRSFWLRTKQGFLAEGMPLLRSALRECSGDASEAGKPGNLILESNTLMQFLKPSLYLVVLDFRKPDFKDSARLQMDHASAFILRHPFDSSAVTSVAAVPSANETPWPNVSHRLLQGKPRFLQREHEDIPEGLHELLHRVLATSVSIGV